jgi:uncharacterized damage-inducible protein DinB
MGTTRTDTPPAWDERSTLLAMLAYVRATTLAKCEGLSEQHARQAPLPTSPMSTIAGFVNHLGWVEHSWFETRFLGEPDRGPWTDEEPDRELALGSELPLQQVLDDYVERCRRSDEIIAAADLDDRTSEPVRDGHHPTLRWVILHMIEETARHNGHLDLLREMADGVTGD